MKKDNPTLKQAVYNCCDKLAESEMSQLITTSYVHSNVLASCPNANKGSIQTYIGQWRKEHIKVPPLPYTTPFALAFIEETVEILKVLRAIEIIRNAKRRQRRKAKRARKSNER